MLWQWAVLVPLWAWMGGMLSNQGPQNNNYVRQGVFLVVIKYHFAKSILSLNVISLSWFSQHCWTISCIICSGTCKCKLHRFPPRTSFCSLFAFNRSPLPRTEGFLRKLPNLVPKKRINPWQQLLKIPKKVFLRFLKSDLFDELLWGGDAMGWRGKGWRKMPSFSPDLISEVFFLIFEQAVSHKSTRAVHLIWSLCFVHGVLAGCSSSVSCKSTNAWSKRRIGPPFPALRNRRRRIIFLVMLRKSINQKKLFQPWERNYLSITCPSQRALPAYYSPQEVDFKFKRPNGKRNGVLWGIFWMSSRKKRIRATREEVQRDCGYPIAVHVAVCVPCVGELMP